MATTLSWRNLDDSSSIAGSAYTTTSSSTVPGPGAIAGKFLKVVGERSLDIVVSIVIRRRLSAIKRTLEKHPHIFRTPTGVKEEKRMIGMYTDLHELCREAGCEYYSWSVQMEAAQLIWEITLLTRPTLPSEGASPTNERWEALVAHVRRRKDLVSGLQDDALRSRRTRSFSPFSSMSSFAPPNSVSEEPPVPYYDTESHKQIPPRSSWVHS